MKRSGCLENAEQGSGSWNVGVIAPSDMKMLIKILEIKF